ncbi:glycerophosphodiester phosphodiesterase [Aestuariivivens sediminicola]|uniref:glycerophosphodiester phosphodiesterase n=1 Tax=Aestuariivivens sediminicola TaxID=2913560 RepID=UPI001F58A39F|nr:glycerophosphodiester phosphodiesterase family protein [Aestuariivivens sediminicola]
MNLTTRYLLTAVLVLSFTAAHAQTKIIAHRGFSSVAPENTLVAFQKAIDCGADYFELDVHKTKNDSIVVIHDTSVDRTSSNNRTGTVAKMDYSDLATVKVGYSEKFGNTFENEKIPTLREALQLAKGKIKVCIEIKVFGIEEEILNIINDLGVKDEVILFSFYYQVLSRVRELDKTIPILFLINKAEEKTIDYAKNIKSDAIGVGNNTTVTKAFLDFAHNNGIEVWKWTVNEDLEMQQLIDLGLDGLITDFPDRALKKSKAIRR